MKKYYKIDVERFAVDGTAYYVESHDGGNIIRVYSTEGEFLMGVNREEAQGLADLLIHLTKK